MLHRKVRIHGWLFSEKLIFEKNKVKLHRSKEELVMRNAWGEIKVPQVKAVQAVNHQPKQNTRSYGSGCN